MIEWPLPPNQLPTSDSSVQVWLVRLDDPRFDADAGQGSLSSDERERAARFKFDLDRRRYVIAHGALRAILARYLNAAPADLQFSTGSNGKPYLSSTFAASAVKFNLSHSHEAALIAISRGREIGVDVEHIREDFAFDEVAERFFTPQEVEALRGLPRHLQREAFYKCWTSKEAFLKAKGTGLSGKLDEVEITLTAETRVQIRAAVVDWSLAELNPCDGYGAALVVEGGASPIRCYRWEPGDHRHS